MQFTGKTIDDAINQGLNELSLTKDEVEIKILEEPTRGFLGIMKGKAVVEITKIQTGGEKATEFIEKIVKLMNLDVKVSYNNDEENPTITLDGESSSVIGYRGEVLDALQTLAGAIANIGKKEYKKVFVDCENYRNRREETLINLAHKLETKAVEMRREVILEPMSPFERRIIHTALSESTTVTTKSEGKEPNRYVVIVPNDKDEFAKPYNAGRNNDHKGGKGGRREDKSKDRRPRGKGGFGGKKNNSPAPQKKKTITFGTYLGNSLKDN